MSVEVGFEVLKAQARPSVSLFSCCLWIFIYNYACYHAPYHDDNGLNF